MTFNRWIHPISLEKGTEGKKEGEKKRAGKGGVFIILTPQYSQLTDTDTYEPTPYRLVNGRNSGMAEMAKLQKREVAGSRNEKSVHMAEWCYGRLAERWNGSLNRGIKIWRNGEMVGCC